MDMNEFEIFKSMINHSKNIVFFTGAGISVPSGIPDFRSADGIYNQKTNLKYELIKDVLNKKQNFTITKAEKGIIGDYEYFFKVPSFFIIQYFPFGS